MHGRLELLVAVPVAIGLLDDDAALREEQPLEHLLHVEAGVVRLAHAERDVLEIAEQRQIADLARCHGHSPRHYCSSYTKSYSLPLSLRACSFIWPRAPAYLPVPPVIARTESPLSRNGPSTV